MEIDVEIGGGGAIPLPLVNAIANQTIITGPVYLRSYSLRDTQGNVPVQGSGNAVAPAAGTVIATTAALPAGTYAVNWVVGLQGAAAAADADNFQLFTGATAVMASVNPGAAGEYVQVVAEVVVTQGSTISVKAIGAGTAGVTYAADLSATPTGEVETIVELLDGSRPVAEVSFRNERVQDRSYGRPGICIVTALNLNVIQGSVSGAVHVSYDDD